LSWRIRSGPARRTALRALHGVRARLFAYSVVLLAIGIAVTVLTVRQILLVRLDQRVEDSLVQEVQEFRSLADGINPRTGLPFGPRLEPLFDLYLQRNVPARGEQLLTFAGGEFYREKDTNPEDFRLSTREDLMTLWANLEEPQSGDLDTPSGPVRYLSVPVSFGEGPRGTFVVSYFTAGERDEIADAVRTAALVGVVVLLIGTAAAYLAAGRLLHPLRELTDTARSISSSDLTRRIDVHGNDELAELGHTFNAMLDRMEIAFSSQRELIRDVSHELRTPITIVRGHLELMGDDPAERRETVELVTDELDRMSRLVDDLLTLARAERPDFLQPEPLRLGDFTHEVYSKATSLGDRRWTLHLQRDGAIDADPQRLTQALVNLADNAVKQTEDGEEIEIGADVENGWARFWVSDSGPGLAEDDRDAVFRRFARGDGGKRYSGTGLGLAIVKAVAEAHGGRAEVDSEPGHGARFTVWVPREGIVADRSTPEARV
jgi:two-component system OmpR family sensor kinase